MPVRKKTPIRKTKDRKNAVVTLQAASHTKAARKPKSNIVKSPSLKTVVIDALADMKALEIKVLDVRGLTDIADCMVIASGTSDRHVRSIAEKHGGSAYAESAGTGHGSTFTILLPAAGK